MDSPSLELIHDCHLYISGEVVVHPSAAIAPGVLLQADPDCRLIIAEGVCIGRGSVIHASGGTLELQVGATLGTGVLIVGSGTIGIEACIGSMTTIFNSSVLPKQSIPPNSLIGDFSRTVTLETPTLEIPPEPTPPNQAASNPATNQTNPTSPFPPTSEAASHQTRQTSADSTQVAAETNGRVAPKDSPQPAAIRKTMTQVYGQAYVERIMITMFPHRQVLEPTEPNPPDPPS